jgi:uncharacterized membrane protein
MRIAVATITIFLLTGVYWVLRYSQQLSLETFCMTISMICVGFILIVTIENNFTNVESRHFWKTLFLACNILSALPVTLRICFLFIYYYAKYHYISYEIYLRDAPLIYLTFVMTFLVACTLGMLINFLVSYLAGFFLMISHVSKRVWYRIQHKGRLFAIDIPLMIRVNVRMVFSYYASEFFIAALWYVILISSSIASFDELWIFIFGHIGWALLPLWALICLLLQYELIGIRWNSEVISPKLFHEFFSRFAIISFIVKLLIHGASFSVMTEIFVTVYILLLISCGFAIGFMSSGKIVIKRAMKEILRVRKIYKWIVIRTLG